MASRPGCRAIGRIEKHHGRRRGVAVGAIVTRVAPQPAGLGPAATGIEHRQRRVVGEDAAAGHDMRDQALVQRLQPPAGGTDPARQGGAADGDAVPLEDPGLPEQGQVVAVTADQHMRDQAGGRETAGQHSLGRRRLEQAAAGTAGAFRPGDP